MKAAKLALCLCTAMTVTPSFAQAPDAAEGADQSSIVVTAVAGQSSGAGTKTDVPLIETPQPISIINAETYQAQGAISIADTLRYVSGVVANPYGADGREDGAFIRGISPLQFRDGMRDLFSYFANIRSDPYNFSQVEVVRGPASVLFGSGSIGGLINTVSKRPDYETHGEMSVRYGSFDRKEILGDVTGSLTDGIAARLVARVRDADTQVDHVSDDRVMLAPSLRFKLGEQTELTLLGLYQEDDGGSISQFLPIVGTLAPNPNGQLPNNTFIGKPGWDRYDGRTLQGTALLEHRFNEHVQLNLKARVIDSDLTYFTHYPNSYSNPANPYLDSAQRVIGLYADGSYASTDVFSTDNNVRIDFNTGDAIEHILLAGVDYSWNRVRKLGGAAFETIDIYDIDYASLSDYGGGIPQPGDAGYLYGTNSNVTQAQLGFYVQDQIRLWDRVSIVLGGRRDHVETKSLDPATNNRTKETANATSFRAGIIAEVVTGFSPFFSYTESFNPISGSANDGTPWKPERGRQYEVGVKLHPDDRTLLTATAYHIRQSNRVINLSPTVSVQAGKATSKGFEIEGRRSLPGDYEIIANFSYNKAYLNENEDQQQLDNVPKYGASAWATKTFRMDDDKSLRLGTGVRYVGENWSGGVVRTPSYTLVDALAEGNWRQWRMSINATNLFNKKHYAACLLRGDCFIGADRNVFGTLTYAF